MIVDDTANLDLATAAIVFALGYFLMSIDVIPDVIPVVGFLDDALVVAEVVVMVIPV